MSLGDLTPYQRQNAYYTGVKLGNDVKKQTEIISNQTKEMIKSQIASTSAIIASQDRIREGIDNISYGIEDVEEGIYGLKAAFEFGISEVVWQIEQNRQVLKDILDVLMSPLDTQAKELRRRAEEAYANGWIEDALEDFLESEKKNKYDFSVFTSIGIIYLFQKGDREKAFEYFEKAIKYAKPKSKYHASFALLHAALIKHDLNFIEEAEKFTAEAVELSPDFAEALYQNAQYNAQLNNVQKSISNIEKAIKLDKNYCIKVDNDPMFAPIRNEVNNLFERLRDKELKWCNKATTALKKFMKNVNDAINQAGDNNINNYSEYNFKSEFQEIDTLLNRNSYFDILDARSKNISLQSKIYQYIKTGEKHLNNLITQIDNKIRVACDSMKENERKRARRNQIYAEWAIFLGPIILGVLLGINNALIGGIVIIVGLIVSGCMIDEIENGTGNSCTLFYYYSENIPTEVNHLSKKKNDINDAIKKLEGIPFKIADSIMK